MSKYPETNNFLKSYGNSVTNEQKTRLRNLGKGGGGRKDSLENSLTNKPYNNGRSFGINFYMNEYGEFVDQGVRGWLSGKTGKGGGNSPYFFKPKDIPYTPQKKSAFIQSLFKWTERKGLPKGMAFPIRRNIWAFGIERTLFFTIPLVRSEKRFYTGLEKSLQNDIENLL